METWKLLLITLLSAVALGCIIGVAWGKYQVKKKREGLKPVLNKKERIIYSACVALGAVCILFGLFVAPRLGQPPEEQFPQYDEFGNPVYGEEMFGDGEDGEIIVGGGGGGTVMVDEPAVAVRIG